MGERERVGAVGERFGGIVVRFEEDAVDACGYCRAGERLDEFGLAAAGVSLAAGELDGMRGVEDDRVAEFFHDGEGANVDDEILVAEGGAAFGEDDVVVAGGGEFFDDIFHIPGREELGFFHVDDAICFGGGFEEIGLAREEGGDLQDVDDFGGWRGLFAFVNVGEDGELQIGFDFGEDAETFFGAGAAEGFGGGAICFVVGGFEDVGDAGVGGDFRDGLGHFARVGFGFDDAGAGDEEKRILAAEAQRVERDFAGVVIWFDNDTETRAIVATERSADESPSLRGPYDLCGGVGRRLRPGRDETRRLQPRGDFCFSYARWPRR